MGKKLARRFYCRDATQVAPDLIGLHLVRRASDGTRKVGRIVETEAYEGPHDLAAHSAGGRRTERTEVMFGEPGRSYVYLIYGMHHCFNVVTAPRGVPHAVLVRGLEPVQGIELRTNGPGLLCLALGINRAHNQVDLCGDELWIERPSPSKWVEPRILTSRRIGIDYSGAWARKPWRYFDALSKWVSKAKP